MRDKNRIEVFHRVFDRQVDISEAAKLLRCSRRTVFRLQRRLLDEGVSALIHGNRGCVPANKTDPTLVARVLKLVRTSYAGINDCHLQELLAERENVRIGRETLRRLLRAEKLGPKRKRRPKQYRGRRPRREAMGMLLQIDASVHAWLEERGPKLTLVGAIDDATGFVWAHFEEAETTWAYLDLMAGVVASHGLPLALYSDRHTIFHSNRQPTILEQLHDQQPLSQFGRAMNELGIEIIKAWSPQAKGRIERQWGTLQDRLVVELRLAGASNREQANAVLAAYLPSYVAKFSVPPTQRQSVFRRPPPASMLRTALCVKETRVVANDHTVSLDGVILQIPASKKFRSIASQKVDVMQLADRSLEVHYRGLCVARFSPQAVQRLFNSKLSWLNSKGVVRAA